VNGTTLWEGLPMAIPGDLLGWTFTFLQEGHRYQFRVTPNRGFNDGDQAVSDVERMYGMPWGGTYVSLGDSYSSGLGSENPQESGSCLRSTGAWAFQLLPGRFSARAHYACAGDTSVGVTGQLDDMDSFFAAHPGKPQLVSLTVGGNDVGFADMVSLCLGFSCLIKETTVRNDITEVKGTLETLYNKIKTRQPFADIIVGGYPKIVQAGGMAVNPTCALFDILERQMIEDLTEHMNATISSAANDVGVWSASSYVQSRFNNHSACDMTDPWVHGVNTEIDGEVAAVVDAKSFHPNPAGQVAYALAFGEALLDFS
jgi:lysophospholipase L1-like esterase